MEYFLLNYQYNICYTILDSIKGRSDIVHLSINQQEIGKSKSKQNKLFQTMYDVSCCALCGKNIRENGRAFNKSHTVPLFCLENIKSEHNKKVGVLNGNYCTLNTPFSAEVFTGVNNAGIFYSICDECDHEKFQNYENEEAMLTKDPTELLDSIAVKIYLKELYDAKFKLFKTKMNSKDIAEDELIRNFLNAENKVHGTVSDVDVRDFSNDLDFALRSFNNHYCNYRLFYHRILDYTVPMAAQLQIPISRNVDYSKLQDVTTYNNKRLEDILLCIFPLKKNSLILLFTRIDNKKIKKYIQQFNKLSEEDKLREVMYLPIRYQNSKFFFSPLIADVLKNENILGIGSMEDSCFRSNNISFSVADFEDRNWKQSMPLILSEQYSMQNLRNKR